MKLTSAIVMLVLFFTKLQHSPTGSPDHINLNQDFVIGFRAIVNGENLIFNQPYQNAFGEQYTISSFRYYIGHIQLRNAATAKVFDASKNSYYLVDASDSTSCSLHLSAPEGSYDQISFTLGVDSIFNVSGAQTGALDPANGMFWTWNSGYIMAKLEGSSPLSHLPNNRIEYHIGGFKKNESVIKKINLHAAQPFSIAAGQANKMVINAEIGAWFSGPHAVKIADAPACTTPGALSKNIADNYAKMFTLATVIN